MPKVYTDPVDDWMADHSEEWSYKAPRKYLAIVDFQAVGVYDNPGIAYEEAHAKYPKGDLTVWYVPREEELVRIL